MKNLRFAVFALVLSFWIPAHAHHLAIVVHQDNHVNTVTSAGLAKIFKSETKKWPDGNDVVVVMNRNSPGALRVVERLAKIPAREAGAFIAAHKSSFVLAESDADVLRIVSGTPGALGLVDVHSIDAKVRVVKVDGKLPLEKDYLPD